MFFFNLPVAPYTAQPGYQPVNTQDFHQPPPPAYTPANQPAPPYNPQVNICMLYSVCVCVCVWGGGGGGNQIREEVNFKGAQTTPQRVHHTKIHLFLKFPLRKNQPLYI